MTNIYEHLKNREFDLSVHHAWLNDEINVATFPLWNLSGQMVGYQQYRPYADKKKNNPHDAKYFTRLKEGKVGVWGLESWHFTDTLFLTEGVFDATKLTSKKVSCIAVLSNDLSLTLRKWLWLIRKQRKVVAVCDNDAAGRRLARYGHLFHIIEEGDLGEASEQYVYDLIRSYK